MRFRFLFLGLVIPGVILLGMSNSAHAQAAAESVLLNGHVGIAGAKAGTAMGNSLSHATSGVASQIQNVPHSNVTVHRTPRTTPSSRNSGTSSKTVTPAAPSTNAGSMITSIQGGRITRPTAGATAQQHN